MDEQRKKQLIEQYGRMSESDKLSTWLWLFERSDMLDKITKELREFIIKPDYNAPVSQTHYKKSSLDS